MSLNKIFLQGRITKEIELKHTPSGVAFVNNSLAVDRDFKDKATGEKKTDFVNFVAFKQNAEFLDRFFQKGRMAIVEGRLQIRDYNDREGNKRTIAEVVADNVYFGDSRKESDQGGGTPPAYFTPDEQFAELQDDGLLPF